MIRPASRAAVTLALLVAVGAVSTGVAGAVAVPAAPTAMGAANAACVTAPSTVGAAGGAAGTAGQATGAAASPPPTNRTADATRNLSFAGRYHVAVANVTYGDPGGVDNLTVNLTGGSQGTIPASSVDSVTVYLENATTGNTVDADTAKYRSHGTTVGFTDPEADAGVDRVRIVAHVADTVADGIRIDAAYAFGTTMAGAYDTAGVQRARTRNKGYIGGTVTNEFGDPIDGASVELINRSSGNTVATLTTEEDGSFVPARQQVVPNTSYRVEVNKFGYVGKTYSSNVFVEPNETELISVTLQLRLAADTLRLARADLGDPNTTADDRLVSDPAVLFADDRSETKATFVAIVENSSVEACQVPESASLFEVNVSLGFATGETVGDFTDNGRIDRRTNVTTATFADIDDDGNVEAYAAFEITADGANDSTMFAPVVNVTPEGSFVNALGNRITATGIEGGGPAFATQSVAFDDQTSGGKSVRVRAATLTEAGFVAIIDENDEVVGHTGLRSAGTYENLTVALDEPLTGDATLTAQVFEDTGDGAFDPVSDVGGVSDDARVTLSGATGVFVDADRRTTDVDGDGRHEDVNGDGEFTIADVQLFFQERNSDVVQDNASLFDFTGDGEVGIADVQALFLRVT